MLRKDGRKGYEPYSSSNLAKYKKSPGLIDATGRPKQELNFRSSQKIANERNITSADANNASEKSSSNSQQLIEEVQTTNRNVKHEYGRDAVEQGQGQGPHLSRSKSKEKKDRLTLNLARLARKNNNLSLIHI